ncbi:MAG: hypothetical protein Q8Q52_08835, partial [Acidimicrobiia bacterium]|nr:hypothetical protein [Acidimicrobiia bacterium]
MDPVIQGRDAMSRHAWEEAAQAFTDADQSEGGLLPEELQLLAEASWWCGRPDDAVEAWERAFAAYLDAGQRSAAAAVGIRLAEYAARRGTISVANGWIVRIERLLEGEPESVAHGWLAVGRSTFAMLLFGDPDAAVAFADQALEIGRRHESADVQSLALSIKGAALVRQGKWAEGMALMDEATIAASSGELAPKTACDVYCVTISTCCGVADYRRAGEWTDQADRWMQRQDIRGYRGECRVYRAELKRLQGSWSEAEQEARHACRELEEFHLMDAVGMAHYEMGEVRLHMGDLAAAEESFTSAHEYGRDPLPGLALLMLARGEVAEAAGMINRKLAAEPTASPTGSESRDLLGRALLLPAQVEIALAANDLETARAAADELVNLAEKFDSVALKAAALQCSGALYLGQDQAEAAIASLSQAWRLWQQIELPYESARARMLLGQARAATGDKGTARLELRAARTTFERLGATLDLRRVNELLAEEGTADPGDRHRVTKTFMFTDIVTSTDLVGLIGDAAWEELLRWHDRALRAEFSHHGGEEVKHTGDWFFVAFD